MNNAAKRTSLDSLETLAGTLEEADGLLEKLLDLQDDYQDLRDEVEYALDCVNEEAEMQAEDFNELSQKLYEESCRIAELNLYVRALEAFCSSTNTNLPESILAGFHRLCEQNYSKMDAGRITFPPALRER